jgi:signal transduction histidine kinase/ActR/RegA family two-component response regulator
MYRTHCPATGETKWIRALGGTAYDEAGEPRRFDGVTLDVTAQRRAQEKLAELLEREQEEGRERACLVLQLREQERRKDEFLATLAHELRNPLAALRFGLELTERGSNPEVTAMAKAAMERQLTHLVRMVDDLLDTSRVTLGKLALKSELVDFRDVLQSALETTRPVIEATGHDFRVIVPASALPIACDPTRLSQVLANLLNNAAKYTPPGGRIELRASVLAAQLHVTITDNGIGIPPDMLEKIFDVFMQIERSMKQAQGGLGLGLTLVRRLVALHGGTVEASSAGVGQGSTFTLRLPLASVGAAAKPNQNAAAVTLQQALRVLVVDDNEDAAECLAALLELQGHQIQLAHSGPDAVASVLAHAPDVVLLDIGLPGFDGYEVARRLRSQLGERVPRLIAVTGFGTADDQRRAHEAGFEAHLVKPITTALLTRTLNATSEPA